MVINVINSSPNNKHCAFAPNQKKLIQDETRFRRPVSRISLIRLGLNSERDWNITDL